MDRARGILGYMPGKQLKGVPEDVVLADKVVVPVRAHRAYRCSAYW